MKKLLILAIAESITGDPCLCYGFEGIALGLPILCARRIVGRERSRRPKRQRFKRYTIGFFHMDIAEVQTAKGKLYLFVGIDRTSKFAVTQLVDKADRRTA
jgi:hypothetical protein